MSRILRDIISSSFLQMDATVSFKTVRDFYGSTSQPVGNETINTESEFQMKYFGDDLILNFLWMKLLNIGMNCHAWNNYEENMSRLVIYSNNCIPKSQSSPRIGISGNRLSYSNFNHINGSNSSSNSHGNLGGNNSNNDNNNGNGNSNVICNVNGKQNIINAAPTSSGYSSGENEKFSNVLLCGTLLRKKDILAGWQSRYFVLQHGRLSYFIDETNFRKGTLLFLFPVVIFYPDIVTIRHSL